MMQPAQDTVPRTPTPTNPPTNQDSTEALRIANAELKATVRQITEATGRLEAVAATSTRRLTRKQKAIAAGTALGLVAVGVAGTLTVQKIRRGRAARRAATPTVSVTNM